MEIEESDRGCRYDCMRHAMQAEARHWIAAHDSICPTVETLGSIHWLARQKWRLTTTLQNAKISEFRVARKKEGRKRIHNRIIGRA